MKPRVVSPSAMLFLACVATQSLGQTIDFSGISGVNVADGNGQTFAWSAGGVSGTVTLSSDWTNLPDQGGPIRTATASGATLDNPFVGALSIAFSRPVQVAFAATFSSLVNATGNDPLYERVMLSTAGPVTFHPLGGTTASYTGAGTQSITADHTRGTMPGTSIWGFVGAGMADQYDFVYTSTRVGLSETFHVIITAVPEPGTAAPLGAAMIGLAAVSRQHRRKPQKRFHNPLPGPSPGEGPGRGL